MARRMLINAIHEEECRIAIAEDDKLLELEVERTNSGQLRGNIYKSTITRIEPSLQAAFLDIGHERNGFLQINDIHPSYFKDWPPEVQENGRYPRPSIQDVLEAGQDLIVQVVKDSREAKGATLTTNLSLPGRYLVLMIGNQRGGVSRKINDEGQRKHLRQTVDKLDIPPGMGVIVRTAGTNRSFQELQADLDGLLEIWQSIVSGSFEGSNPNLLYRESGLAIRAIRDYLTPDIDEILIDHEETYEEVKRFVSRVLPKSADAVKLYSDSQPLFSHFHLDSQVDETNSPEVTLPSGGSIVITPTEAVVTIDVNSGRATSQADVEETAFATNKEAAATIAKQLRLRDLGGLVVIDFIDMWDKRHKQGVERALKEGLKTDKAKIEMGRISKFGLLEMSRQRLKSSLVSQSYSSCAHCNGTGRIKTTETTSLEALRKLQSAVFAGDLKEVRLRMAPSAAFYVLNNKRRFLTKLEDNTKTTVLVYPDGRLRADEYKIELGNVGKLQSGESEEEDNKRQSRGSSDGGNDRRRNQGNRGNRGRNNRRGNNRKKDGREGSYNNRRGRGRKSSSSRDESKDSGGEQPTA